MKKIITILLIASIFSACSNKKQEKLAEVKKAESELFGNMSAPIDMKKAESIIVLYSSFVADYPDDSNSVAMMLKAAEISMNIGKPKDAIALLDRLILKYPSSEFVPKALHLEGFIYDDKLKNAEMSRKTFEKLIEKYPNHELSRNAKDYMTTIGKSEEEIIKEFEEKNKTN